MKRKLKWTTAIVLVLTLGFFSGGLWFASSQLLFPSFNGSTNGPFICSPEAEKYWGGGCGNLRETRQFKFSDVQIRSVNGYDLPGWRIKASDNGMEQARGVIMLVPAGGSDKREETRYIQFFLSQKLDVLTLDLGCQGEAPCPMPGLTYGQRESRDVFSAYLYLTEKYEKVYAMGSSVGAASILVALPEMPKLAGVIAENPLFSYQRLIKEAPESQSLPGWATDVLIWLAMVRGRFDGLQSAENSLRLTKTTPVFFIHSKEDKVISYQQTQELYDLYPGHRTIWFSDKGEHTRIWDVDPAAYEKRVVDFLDSTK
jgi:alpha-beta hydrolase superfamily lysophospholipase